MSSKPRPSILGPIIVVGVVLGLILKTAIGGIRRGGAIDLVWFILMVIACTVLLIGGYVFVIFVWKHFQFRTSVMGRAMRIADRDGVEVAIRDVSQILDERPENGAAWNALGILLGKQEKWVDVVEALRRACELGFNNEYLYNNLAIALWKTGHPEDAVPILKSESEKRPHDLTICCNYLQVLVAAGYRDDAVALWPEHERRFRTNFAVGPKSFREARRKLMEETRTTVLSLEVNDSRGSAAPTKHR
jgi:hypothetical protein